jgi:hypothetical protein
MFLFASLNGTFHLSPNENIFTIARIKTFITCIIYMAFVRTIRANQDGIILHINLENIEKARHLKSMALERVWLITPLYACSYTAVY